MTVLDRWIQVNNLNVHYLQAGEDGSSVLLLHGGGLDTASLSYRPVVPLFSQAHRVFAPDWPGYGQSDKPDLTYSVGYYVAFLGDLIDSLGLDKVSLVGLSLGGEISLGYALRFPERIRSLVLMGSAGLGRNVPGGALSYLFVQLPLINRLTWLVLGSSRWILRKSLEAIVWNDQVVTEELVEEVYRLASQPDAGRAWRGFQKHEIQWDGTRTSYLERLHDLRTPTLLIHGERDNAVPAAQAERAHRLIAGSELRLIPECGHWVPREKPEEFSRLVLDFLSKQGS